MEKEFYFQDVSNSNFEPILTNLFDQDLFPGMTKNGFLTFTYILIYIYIFSCLTHLNERLIIMSSSLSGENHLIIHEEGCPVHANSHIALANKKCFSQYNPIHSFL